MGSLAVSCLLMPTEFWVVSKVHLRKASAQTIIVTTQNLLQMLFEVSTVYCTMVLLPPNNY